MHESLPDLALFVEIARSSSFTRAAERLSLPVSSVSRKFARFESRLGIRLINRNSRRLELTDAGREFYFECERVVDEALAIQEKLIDRRDAIAGLIRVSTTPDFGALVFAPLLARFSKDHPNVHFELDLTPQFVDLIATGTDVAIRFGRPKDSRLTMRSIGEIGHGLYASRTYLHRYGTPKSPADLRSHVGIQLAGVNRVSPTVSRKGRSERIEFQAKHSSNHMSMLRSLALLNLGIALIPELVVRADVASAALLPVLSDWRFPPVPVVALSPSRLMSARVRIFYDFVCSETRSVL